MHFLPVVLDFGIIIDGAVVIVENCVRRLAHAHAQALAGRPLTRDERFHEVFAAAREARRPLLYGQHAIDGRHPRQPGRLDGRLPRSPRMHPRVRIGGAGHHEEGSRDSGGEQQHRGSGREGEGER